MRKSAPKKRAIFGYAALLGVALFALFFGADAKAEIIYQHSDANDWVPINESASTYNAIWVNWTPQISGYLDRVYFKLWGDPGAEDVQFMMYDENWQQIGPMISVGADELGAIPGGWTEFDLGSSYAFTQGVERRFWLQSSAYVVGGWNFNFDTNATPTEISFNYQYNGSWANNTSEYTPAVTISEGAIANGGAAFTISPETPASGATSTQASGDLRISGEYAYTVPAATSTSYSWRITAQSREHEGDFFVYDVPVATTTASTTYSGTFQLPEGTFDIRYERKEVSLIPKLCNGGTVLCGTQYVQNVYEPDNGYHDSVVVISTSTYAAQWPELISSNSTSSDNILGDWLADMGTKFRESIDDRWPANYIYPLFDFFYSLNPSTSTDFVFTYGMSIASSTSYVTTSLATFYDQNLTLSGETHTVSYWFKLATSLSAIIAWCVFSYRILLALFGHKTGQLTLWD